MNDAIIIPENHRRSLSATAQLIDQTLDELEELLRDRKKESVASHLEQSYSVEERRRLLTAIAALRSANHDVFIALHLQATLRIEAQIVRAKNAYLWTVLMDSKANGMRGFGDLTEEQATLIDTHVDKLLKLLKEIQ